MEAKYKLGTIIWEWDKCDDYPAWFLSKSPGITHNTRITEEALIEMGAVIVKAKRTYG